MTRGERRALRERTKRRLLLRRWDFAYWVATCPEDAGRIIGKYSEAPTAMNNCRCDRCTGRWERAKADRLWLRAEMREAA